ncbi:MAG: Hpt domain-containing protein [Leptospira sp.]|nr:Hpt domain-containing protein [Leptospira sp.]
MQVDWTRIEALIDGDDPSDLEWIKDMIRTLYENMEIRISNINQYCDSENGENLKSELHQIKGVAANFGLMDLYNAVISAELKIKENDITIAIQLSKKVPGIWEETKKELKTKYP